MKCPCMMLYKMKDVAHPISGVFDSGGRRGRIVAS